MSEQENGSCDQYVLRDRFQPKNDLSEYRQCTFMTKQALKYMPLRRDEIDTTARLWTLPAERAKNAIVHTTPLTDTALEILEEQRLRRDGNDPHVFPARTGKAAHLRTDSIGTALTRAIRAAGLTHFTAHDLRRTTATRISGAGTSHEMLRQILNHVDRSATARYDRHRYDNEKREALERWAATLRKITNEG